jgi:hypothetical protein
MYLHLYTGGHRQKILQDHMELTGRQHEAQRVYDGEGLPARAAAEGVDARAAIPDLSEYAIQELAKVFDEPDLDIMVRYEGFRQQESRSSPGEYELPSEMHQRMLSILAQLPKGHVTDGQAARRYLQAIAYDRVKKEVVLHLQTVMRAPDMRLWELKQVADAHHAVMRDGSALSALFDSAPITNLVRRTSTSPVPRAARRLQAALVAANEPERPSTSGRGPNDTCYLHSHWRNLHTNATCWEQHPEQRPAGTNDRRAGRSGAASGRGKEHGDSNTAGRGRGAAGRGDRGRGNDRGDSGGRGAPRSGAGGGNKGAALVGSSAPCTTPFCTTPHTHLTSQCPVAAAERLRELALRRAQPASRPATGNLRTSALVGASAAPSEYLDARSLEDQAFVAGGPLALQEPSPPTAAPLERLSRLEQDLMELRAALALPSSTTTSAASLLAGRPLLYRQKRRVTFADAPGDQDQAAPFEATQVKALLSAGRSKSDVVDWAVIDPLELPSGFNPKGVGTADVPKGLMELCARSKGGMPVFVSGDPL